ncbi:MAG: zinc-ribbon domain-containing protein [Deltaproteobacteria bacterium]|jgi:DNA-directed RNA polymerase subunit RPC12/RpoP|nr:zinc-ribbon domain-containing protein [Deltaproteobacteria bacterium]
MTVNHGDSSLGPSPGPRPQKAETAQIATCPKCQAKYRIAEPIPANGLTFDCGYCRAKLVVRPHAPASPLKGQASPLASGPWPGDPAASQANGQAAGQTNGQAAGQTNGQAASQAKRREVFCPSCLAPTSVDLADGRDAWVVCPHCGEKFLALANPAFVSYDVRPKDSQFKPSRVKSRLILKVDKMAQLYEIGVQGASSGQKRRLALAVAAAILVAFGLYAYLLIHSWRGAASLAEASPLATEVGERRPYRETDFKADLLNFKRWSRDKYLSNYSIDYSGYASRLFKHAVARLAPSECQEFTSLTLNASKKAGVSLIGHCYNSRLANPSISIEWKGREAIVSVPGSAEIINVELFPPN